MWVITKKDDDGFFQHWHCATRSEALKVLMQQSRSERYSYKIEVQFIA